MKKAFGPWLIFLGLIVLYILLTDVFQVLDPFLFPSLFAVIPLLVEYFPVLMKGLISSLSLLIPSFGLSILLGILLGIPIGLVSKLRNNVSPIISALSAIPATMLTPYAIQVLPSFRDASLFIIFIGTFWTILGSTVNGVRTINKKYLEVSDTLEISGFQKVTKVILPGASPTILNGINIAMRLAFLLLTVAEMFGVDSGMGYFIEYYSEFARYDLVMVGFIFMAIVLVTISYLYNKFKDYLLRWTINN